MVAGAGVRPGIGHHPLFGDGTGHIGGLHAGPGNVHHGRDLHPAAGVEYLDLNIVFLLELVDELPGVVEVGGLRVVAEHPGGGLGLALQGGQDGGGVVAVHGQGKGGHRHRHHHQGGPQGVEQPTPAQLAPGTFVRRLLAFLRRLLRLHGPAFPPLAPVFLFHAAASLLSRISVKPRA